MKLHTALIVLVLLIGPIAHAQDSDVTFFVIGKHGNFSQYPDGHRESVDFSFFSEIFLTTDGEAADATLTFPTDEKVPFRDMRTAMGGERDNILLISSEDRFTDYASLQARYPDGEYRVNFNTPSGAVQDGVLKFENRKLPAPPQVSLQQGAVRGLQVLKPGMDAIVSWSAFAEGRSDPHDILDDLVFVILTDEEGVRVAHSGRPFEGRPYLTYADKVFAIDGQVLEHNHTYELSVEHAILDDTSRFKGVPAFTTRAVTTKLIFTTTAAE